MEGQIKDNANRSSALITMLKIYLGFSVIDVLLSLYQYQLWSEHDFSVLFNLFYGFFGLIFLVLIIITIVQFIQWFRRAYCNLNRVGIVTDKKEGWASGAWFIPIYNLFAPYQIMKEIWNKTQKYYKENSDQSNLLWSWWSLWIASNIIINRSTLMEIRGELETAAILGIIGSIILVASTYVTIILIKKVSSFEKEMYEKAISNQDNITSEILD